MRLCVRTAFAPFAVSALISTGGCTSGTAPVPVEQALPGEWSSVHHGDNNPGQGALYLTLAVQGNAISGKGICTWACPDSLTVSGTVDGQHVRMSIVSFPGPYAFDTMAFDGTMLGAKEMRGVFHRSPRAADTSTAEFAKTD